MTTQAIKFEWKEDICTGEADYNMSTGDTTKTVGCVEKNNAKDRIAFKWIGIVYLPRMVLTFSSDSKRECIAWTETKIQQCMQKGLL